MDLMDPDANLNAQRELVALLLGGITDEDVESAIETAVFLAELVRALDECLIKGGAIPKAWRQS